MARLLLWAVCVAAGASCCAAWSLNALTDATVIKFLRDGHVVTRGLLAPDLVEHELKPSVLEMYEANQLQTWQHKVRVYVGDTPSPPETVAECQKLLHNVPADTIPFMQLFNLWYGSEGARSVALAPELGRVAATLLGCSAVRVYQDSLFVKRRGDGPTSWHSDLNMAPFDTNDFITCWIPLQPVPEQEAGGSGLSYASGSHRDVALPFWSDPCETDLSDRYEDVVDHGAFAVGDCAWHHGWCLHSAPGNALGETRYAYTVSFVRDGARLLQSEGHVRYPDNEDDAVYATWIDDIGWGGRAEHTLLPLTWYDDEAA